MEQQLELKMMKSLSSYIENEFQLVKSEISHQIESSLKEDQQQVQRLLEENEHLKSKYEVLAAQIQNILSKVDLNCRETSKQQHERMNNIPRSCSEILFSDPSAKSGNYYVDPDGTDVGDDPISVYCDMINSGLCVYISTIQIR